MFVVLDEFKECTESTRVFLMPDFTDLPPVTSCSASFARQPGRDRAWKSSADGELTLVEEHPDSEETETQYTE